MALSGQTTVTTAGTAVVLGSQYANAPVAVKALSTNSGLVYLGNDGEGDVSSASGFELAAGEVIVLDYAGHLGSILIDAAVSGEGVSWAILVA